MWLAAIHRAGLGPRATHALSTQVSHHYKALFAKRLKSSCMQHCWLTASIICIYLYKHTYVHVRMVGGRLTYSLFKLFRYFSFTKKELKRIEQHYSKNIDFYYNVVQFNSTFWKKTVFLIHRDYCCLIMPNDLNEVCAVTGITH